MRYTSFLRPNNEILKLIAYIPAKRPRFVKSIEKPETEQSRFFTTALTDPIRRARSDFRADT